MKFEDLVMTKINKKNRCHEKKSTFPKVKVMIGRVTKYELLTPRELEDIPNLAKTFFSIKKKVCREQFDFYL